jgi:hypothetical protein
MSTIVFAVLVVMGLASGAEAGRRGSRSSSAPSGTGSKSSSHAVRGYTNKKSGTYVAPHRQTTPDRTQRNNYATKGNVNTYTGKAGTRNATR